MRLPTFIIDNIDRIIAAWKAAAHPAASPLEGQAKQILMAVAADIESGATAATSSAVVTVRTTLRAAPDFSVQQVGEALRLLRSVVPAAWQMSDPEALGELQRFHEAIDFAVGETIAQHALQVERTRSLFLGMLGHDLRTPLSAIHMTCQYLARTDVTEERKREAVTRISRCAGTMEGMVRDVLDFARSRLGKTMAIATKPADIGAACRDALEDARAEHARCEFRFHGEGELDGAADAARLRQALRNLLDCAARNGARGMPILFTATGTGEAITFRVECAQSTATAETLRTLFDPIAQLAIAGANPDNNPPANLGLELFIAREIFRTHGGDVDIAAADNGGAVFEARLPRRQVQ
ncbi:HAMP domain-containing sensor histidine kinase [Noviherbaspirillum sp.]|uniref:sensor histidine kinase n=1 Tax=Noviherbaspirillum sp. TaxID=1926288 RepID=UPI002D5203D6|nr:HAMP domain-containing sensor histidine kinase [Noviherbaspirillum sp.]HZW21837.1 HAMP domain-containing sensor histidine kinase [Noviherbaspirillum sp.]